MDDKPLADQRRFALVIASADYDDETLRRLVAPPRDAEALARVLEDPSIGHFDVTTLTNAHSFTVLEKLESFFDRRRRDDLLLVYFSGHGIKSESGRLYFATTNTRTERLRSTAVPASFLHDVMEQSRSRRQVLMLDCCHSGAFVRGMTAKAGSRVGLAERFEGRGRVVLTASDAVQYAFEGGELTGEGARSIFTRSLVEGLRTGAADLDGDGFISLDELYDYLDAQVSQVQSQQQPHMWAFDVRGEICVALNPSGTQDEGGQAPVLAEPAVELTEPVVEAKALKEATEAADDGTEPVSPVASPASQDRQSTSDRPGWLTPRAIATELSLLAVIALVVLAGLSWNRFRDAGRPPEPVLGGGLLAVETVTGATRDIVILRPNGTVVRNLTRGQGDNVAPAWSWDRSRVAFSSNRDGPYALYVADVSTGEEQKVTDGGGETGAGLIGDFAAAWRPDDGALAFPRRLSGGGFDLYEVELASGEARQLTSGPGAEQRPAWSPDGELLLFQSDRDGDFDLYGLEPGAEQWRRFTDDEDNNRHPVMSPDGSLIVFDSDRAGGRDIMLMATAGGSARNLTNGTPPESQKPSFSPDGDLVVFESIRDERSSIFRMRLDGTDLRQVDTAQRADPAW